MKTSETVHFQFRGPARASAVPSVIVHIFFEWCLPGCSAAHQFAQPKVPVVSMNVSLSRSMSIPIRQKSAVVHAVQRKSESCVSGGEGFYCYIAVWVTFWANSRVGQQLLDDGAPSLHSTGSCVA